MAPLIALYAIRSGAGRADVAVTIVIAIPKQICRIQLCRNIYDASVERTPVNESI
jgi:hypothetical protein